MIGFRKLSGTRFTSASIIAGASPRISGRGSRRADGVACTEVGVQEVAQDGGMSIMLLLDEALGPLHRSASS